MRDAVEDDGDAFILDVLVVLVWMRVGKMGVGVACEALMGSRQSYRTRSYTLLVTDYFPKAHAPAVADSHIEQDYAQNV